MARLKQSLLGVLIFCLLGGTTPAFADDSIQKWTIRAYNEFTVKQRYPRRAINAGIEGTVLVNIEVNQAGSIIGFSIRQSSGSDILDGEVLSLLARVDPLPELPEGMATKRLTVPLTYRLERDTRASAPIKATSASSNMKDWSRSVSRILERNQSYPSKLLKAGIEGVVVVELEIAASGDITAQRVSKSSGNELMDMEALDLFWRVTPLPALPSGRDTFKVNIPLKYEISGNRRRR